MTRNAAKPWAAGNKGAGSSSAWHGVAEANRTLGHLLGKHRRKQQLLGKGEREHLTSPLDHKASGQGPFLPEFAQHMWASCQGWKESSVWARCSWGQRQKPCAKPLGAVPVPQLLAHRRCPGTLMLATVSPPPPGLQPEPSSRLAASSPEQNPTGGNYCRARIS